MVICLEQGADLHIAQLMPLPVPISCFSEIEIGFAFLVPAHLCSPGQWAVKWVCVLGLPGNPGDSVPEVTFTHSTPMSKKDSHIQ